MAILVDNPVLQRELIINLRQTRAFALLLAYLLVLGGLVYVAWPQDLRIEMHSTTRPEASRRLVNMFFLGQYLLASLFAPSFAAGAMTSEKERKTYELMLTTPLRPAAVLAGKLFGSLCHLVLLVFSSLPIVMLCLPLGGTSPVEVAAVYLAMLLSIATFGLISIAWSSYFQHTAASLVVSYLSILPLALSAVLFWQAFAGAGAVFRVTTMLLFLPVGCFALWTWLWKTTTERLVHPPDLGSEGREVVDEEIEMQQAVGLVIQRDQFPDRLFAPPKRTDLIEDNANPVYDKEVHSEIFSQGTLMLRIVIQVSMILAIPLMGVCLYLKPEWARWYIGYVLLFNLLVGPVFSAGSVTSERERGTLDLLLTTTLSPWQILWGKLLSSLRVSTVLTLFLVWPILLSCLMTSEMWPNLLSIGLYLAIILMTCVTTGVVALFASVLFRKTSVSLLTSYTVVLLIFFAPLAGMFFTQTFYQDARIADLAERVSFVSPFAAAFGVPFESVTANGQMVKLGFDWPVGLVFLGFYAAVNVLLVFGMMWLFNRRWRVAN